MDNIQWHFNQITKLFIHENSSEKIGCEMVVILSNEKLDKWRCEWVKSAPQVVKPEKYRIIRLHYGFLCPSFLHLSAIDSYAVQNKPF